MNLDRLVSKHENPPEVACPWVPNRATAACIKFGSPRHAMEWLTELGIDERTLVLTRSSRSNQEPMVHTRGLMGKAIVTATEDGYPYQLSSAGLDLVDRLRQGKSSVTKIAAPTGPHNLSDLRLSPNGVRWHFALTATDLNIAVRSFASPRQQQRLLKAVMAEALPYATSRLPSALSSEDRENITELFKEAITLLTSGEGQTRHSDAHLDLLSDRLLLARGSLHTQPDTRPTVPYESSAAYSCLHAIARFCYSGSQETERYVSLIDALTSAFVNEFSDEGRTEDTNRLAVMRRIHQQIIPDPVATPGIDRRHLTPTVCAIAKGIQDYNRFDNMPVLADALEDAGCEDPLILDHCRAQDGRHIPGDWVLDRILSPLDEDGEALKTSPPPVTQTENRRGRLLSRALIAFKT